MANTQQGSQAQAEADSVIDKAVAEGGAYELIKQRLNQQGQELARATQALNAARLDEFGNSDMAVVARVRVRTENNCIPRDLVQVGEYLLFGYNVFIGLKKETQISDVFALFKAEQKEDGIELLQQDASASFLSDKRFGQDFAELYRYYKHTKLVELTVKDSKLLMGFQIGERLDDIRVFRWAMSPDAQKLEYIDNRGERDIQLPPAHDFEWQACSREHTVHGRHPHVNILDTVFVETIGGDLTIKIENNTEDGLGIYREPVDDKTQSIDDAAYHYAQLGDLILLKIRPYREENWRYFVFNTTTQAVLRMDAIGASCVQLPEDHGVVFPGGYYLRGGDWKIFDEAVEAMRFKRMLRSPNGEDVLYVFYEPEEGRIALLAYNIIAKQLANPILCNGYALADSGQLILFSAEDEATRVHPMQIWTTPYQSDEFASLQPASRSFLGRIGNATLVRGISDLFSVARAIEKQSVSVRLYEDLASNAAKIFDNHYWIDDSGEQAELNAVAPTLRDIISTAELAIDEFAKVENIREQSISALNSASGKQKKLVESIRTASWETAEEYVQALDSLRQHSGHLATIKQYRYMDQQKIASMEQQLSDVQATLSTRTADFLATEGALLPYYEKIENLNQQVVTSNTNAELKPLLDNIESTAAGLDLLSELLASLKVDDATQRTRIIDAISEVYAQLNQSKAEARHKQKNLGSAEAVAEFSAQFKLFNQSITNALGLANSPEACDEGMSRLLIQLEELETRFANYEQFLGDIMAKREEIYENFEAHKQRLLDERARRAQAIADAASRVINNVEQRSTKFSEAEKLNTYFASDPMVHKIQEFVANLRELNASVMADDVEARFKATREQALRVLRDKTDMYSAGGDIIKLGPRHQFSVNTQALDLTILPRNDELYFHLSGTDYFAAVNNEKLDSLRDYWKVNLESESDAVYRAEYLAASIMRAAERGEDGLNPRTLQEALLDHATLLKLVRDFATPRYKEGYDSGIHDQDATFILQKLIPAIEAADLLIFDPKSRGLAQVFWANIERISQQLKHKRLSYETWEERAQSAARMRERFGSHYAHELLSEEIHHALVEFIQYHPIACSALELRRAADYLVHELGRERCEFIGSRYAHILAESLKRSLDDDAWRRFQIALEKMMGWPAERWSLSCAWLQSMIEDARRRGDEQLPRLTRYIPEAAALINADTRIDRRSTEVDLELSIDGLRGEHPRIRARRLDIAIDEFSLRLDQHHSEFVPRYREYLALRQNVINKERESLGLAQFKARPLSSFVRNKLINEAYLPIIGDNLAKQMGAVGESKRSDLMGLLMMISPPGYGKTTLMEYVANRLGLIFVKVNCPSLGHDVLSLDPAQAPNATAKQELEKLNLGLEMGNNVMLYLDDIQHTHPEFLQKFISLCDGTRRIEGIWRGKSKTYDMRGKKFCVVMAGNPYTESGEVFKIPDMLANRADIYNLGDILGGMDDAFALSYIENSLTSNAVLAPLATRDINDVYLLIRLARGDDVATNDLSHPYSGAEINEICDVLRKLFVVRDVVLKINQQYILSAAQADQYRIEPPFKLQGSYRNMNKMAEKISSVMNNTELMSLIADHYQGEAQLLTTGAEENLLKLAELRGNMTQEQQTRWQQIKQDFLRNKAMGGDESDTGIKLVAQLHDLNSGLREGIEKLLKPHDSATVHNDDPIRQQQLDANSKALRILLKTLNHNLSNLEQRVARPVAAPQVEVINQPVPGIDKLLQALANTIEHTISPLVRNMDKKLDIDLRTYNKMIEVSEQLRDLERQVTQDMAVKNVRKPQPPTPK